MSVHVETTGPVTVITLDRPESRNSLDAESMALIGEALVDAEADPAIGAVILTATGDKAFCAGMDLRAFAAGAAAVDTTRPGLEVLQQRVYGKPVVAAVNGAAVGGGFELALACDVIVAARGARFGVPEVRRGLLPAGGGTRLSTRIPHVYAMELLLTGELISAERAQDFGLVNRLVDADQLLPTAMELATTMAANAPLALAAVKRLAWANVEGTPVTQIHDEMHALMNSEDAREGAVAFGQKRAPQWQGR